MKVKADALASAFFVAMPSRRCMKDEVRCMKDEG